MNYFLKDLINTTMIILPSKRPLLMRAKSQAKSHDLMPGFFSKHILLLFGPCLKRDLFLFRLPQV